MKIPSFFLCLFMTFASFAHADGKKLCPLWEEDEHFAYYRCLMLESSVIRLQESVDMLQGGIKDRMQYEINLIKFNLGLIGEVEPINSQGS